MTSTQILGCRVDALSSQEATRRLIDAIDDVRIRQRDPVFVVTIGTEMIVRAQRDEKFRETINRAQFSLCDTIGVLLASKLRGGPLRERVTGVDLVEKICAESAIQGKSIFLFGANQETIELAAEKLMCSYPGLRIVGTRNGYFNERESDTIALMIRNTNADILFVGLGSPRQEYWIDGFLLATGCAVGVGVGGSFDVLSGRKSRAPRFWQAIGLEWLYRLIQEPQRWRRQLSLPYFVFLAVSETLTAFLPRRSARR